MTTATSANATATTTTTPQSRLATTPQARLATGFARAFRANAALTTVAAESAPNPAEQVLLQINYEGSTNNPMGQKTIKRNPPQQPTARTECLKLDLPRLGPRLGVKF
jgi:hypothetical protein